MKELERILDTYARHIERLAKKAAKAQRPLSNAELRGVAFYRTAAQAVQALINQ